ncbi:MAG: AI-2E family transporter [Micrococcus sp.]|nr:AI-2E family transporter [Micrococcus sp.]
MERDVPYGLTVAAAWAWRIVLVIIMLGVAWWLLSHISLLVIPLLVAALLATLLAPLFNGMRKIKIPGIVASLLCVLFLVGLVVGLLYFTGQALVTGFASLSEQLVEVYNNALAWIEDMGFSTAWASSALSFDGIVDTLRNNSSTLLDGAISFGSTATNLGVGLFLALFALIFFLYDGGRIWRFVLLFVPTAHREAMDHAGAFGWRALGQYVRVQIFVAFVDAVGIGLGAFLLGVPLAFPLGVLVFLAAFIPMVGATLTGALAVLLALLANGWVNALLMLGVVLLVQQLESNVLQPVVMGKAVSLHPLAVFLAVAGGSAVWGLVGAIFIVPILAFVNAFVRGLKEWQRQDEEDPADTGPTGSHAPGAVEAFIRDRTAVGAGPAVAVEDASAHPAALHAAADAGMDPQPHGPIEGPADHPDASEHGNRPQRRDEPTNTSLPKDSA